MNVKQQVLEAILAVFRLLPLTFVRGAGEFFGLVTKWLRGRSYKITDKNLRLCLPELTEQQHQVLLHKRLKMLGSTGLEMLKVWAAGEDTLSLIQQVHGEELMRQGLNDNKGVVVLAPHLGNWEVVGLYLTQLHTPVTSMYQPPKYVTLGNYIRQAREKTGALLVPTDRSGVIKVLKALKAGHITGILPDQVPAPESGQFQAFFGHQALTMTLLSSLVAKTGAKVVCAYAIACDGGFELNFCEPDPEIYSKDLSTSVAALNTSIENCVRQYPEHYQWEYKRFKRQPNGEQSLYS